MTDPTRYEIWQRRIDPIGVQWGPFEATYSGDIDVDPGDTLTALETLFRIFNIERPADFTGASLSVGDRVVLGETTFRVRAFGFDTVPHPSTEPATLSLADRFGDGRD